MNLPFFLLFLYFAAGYCSRAEIFCRHQQLMNLSIFSLVVKVKFAGPAEACSRSTARISPARNFSLGENFRSRQQLGMKRTLPAQIFYVLLKHPSSPANT